MKRNLWNRIDSHIYWTRYVLGSLAYLLWPTPKRVRRYFSHGIRKHWEWVKMSEWHEYARDPLIISASVTAQAEDGEMFYQTVSIAGQTLAEIRRSSGSLERMMDVQTEKMADSTATLNRFLDPQCYCKYGPHWHCKIHYTWSN